MELGVLHQRPLMLVILEHMADDRPQADRILVAQMTGEARYRASTTRITRWEPG